MTEFALHSALRGHMWGMDTGTKGIFPVSLLISIGLAVARKAAAYGVPLDDRMIFSKLALKVRMAGAATAATFSIGHVGAHRKR